MKFSLGIALLLASVSARADIEAELARMKGFTILGAFTVTGFVEKNGKKSDSFEGCDFGRRIILDDSFTVECEEYDYRYAYMPKAIVFGDGTSLRMLVSGRLYRIAK